MCDARSEQGYEDAYDQHRLDRGLCDVVESVRAEDGAHLAHGRGDAVEGAADVSVEHRRRQGVRGHGHAKLQGH